MLSIHYTNSTIIISQANVLTLIILLYCITLIIDAHVFDPLNNSRINLIQNIEPLDNVRFSFISQQKFQNVETNDFFTEQQFLQHFPLEKNSKIHHSLSQLKMMMSQSTQTVSPIIFSDITSFDSRNTAFVIPSSDVGSSDFSSQSQNPPNSSPNSQHQQNPANSPKIIPSHVTQSELRPFGDGMVLSLGNFLRRSDPVDILWDEDEKNDSRSAKKSQDEKKEKKEKNATFSIDSNTIELLLEIDENVIGAPEGELPYVDGYGYMTQTNYKGKFMSDDEEVVILVSLTPIGDAHRERLEKVKNIEKNANDNKLETQSADEIIYTDVINHINNFIEKHDDVIGDLKGKREYYVEILADFLSKKTAKSSRMTPSSSEFFFSPFDITTSSMSLLDIVDPGQIGLLDVGEGSGRYRNGFTIDATIITSERTYFVSPASTLLFQIESKFESAQILHEMAMERFVVNSIGMIDAALGKDLGDNNNNSNNNNNIANITNITNITPHLETELQIVHKTLSFATSEMTSLMAQYESLLAAQQTASYDLVSYNIHETIQWNPESDGTQPCSVVHGDRDQESSENNQKGPDNDDDNSWHKNPSDLRNNDNQNDQKDDQKNDQKDDQKNDQNEKKPPNPFEMSPQWTLSRIPCTHSRKDVLVHFWIRAYSSLSFSSWASGSSSHINSNMVIARIKYYFHSTSHSWSQQWSTAPVLQSLVIMTAPSTDLWNPVGKSDYRCTDTTGTQAQNMLKSLALRRRQNLSEQIGSQHFLFATCNEYGVVGVNYLNVGCSSQIGAGYGSFTTQSPMVLSHELGHGILGLDHPFGSDTSKAGNYGGTMDYFRVRLPDTVEGARMNGFNPTTDRLQGCSVLNSIHTRPVGTAGYVSASNCYSTPGTKANTCGNGVIDAFEGCDYENECCQDCKLAPNATCDGTNSQCCTNCQLEPFTKRCDINWKDDGICSNGKCLPLLCPTNIPGSKHTPAPPHSCPDSSFFPPSATSECYWRCPSADADPNGSSAQQAGCNAFNLSQKYLAQIGTRCTTPNGVGICMPAADFTQTDANSPLVCTDVGIDVYTWNLALVQQCDCLSALPKNNVYSFTCHDISGLVVSDSYCSDLPKPALPPCDCTVTYNWKYGSWGSECGLTECGFGATSRTATCQSCSNNLCIDLPDQTACISALLAPYTLRQCEYTPTSDKECSKGDNSGYICLSNTNYEPLKVPLTPFMICVCQNGWGGDLCRVEPSISDVIITPTASDSTLAPKTLFPDQDIVITWLYSGITTNTVTITYYPTASTSATAQKVVLSRSTPASDQTFSTKIPTNYPSNNNFAASIRITINNTNLGADSDGFSVLLFQWMTEVVGFCYGQCGTSVQKQNIFCQRSDAINVSSSYCNYLTAPIPSIYKVCRHEENISCSLAGNISSGDQYCVDNQCGKTPLQYLYSPTTSSNIKPVTQSGICELGAFNAPECKCRVAYLTLEFTYAPTSFFVDDDLSSSAKISAASDDDNNTPVSKLTPQQRIEMMEYFDIIRAHYARRGGIPINRIFVANYKKIYQARNKNVIDIRVTMGFRAFCNGIDGAEVFLMQSDGQNEEKQNSVSFLPLQQKKPNPQRFQQLTIMNTLQERDLTKVATPLDEIYGVMETIISAMLSNDLLIRNDVKRLNAPSTGIIITAQSASNNPIYDPLCTIEQLSQYSSCFYLNNEVNDQANNNPFRATTPLDEPYNSTKSIGDSNIMVIFMIFIGFFTFQGQM